MKTIKQLLRQPLKTVIGITLMTLAAAILCLCVGQAMAAHTTKAALDQRFSTIGIPLAQESLDGTVYEESFVLGDELLTWVNKMATEYPGIVKGMARHGILSAYIPQMTPYNPAIEHSPSSGPTSIFEEEQESSFIPYTCAMLVIRLEFIGTVREHIEKFACEPYRLTLQDFSDPWLYVEYLDSLQTMSAQTGYHVYLKGSVTQVLGLQEDYRNPVGRTAQMVLQFPTEEHFAALGLELGKEYIVYGMDYVDNHAQLIREVEIYMSYFDVFDVSKWDPFDPELLHIFTEEEVEKHHGLYVATYNGYNLNRTSYANLNSISLTLADPASMIHYDEIRDESGFLQELVEKTQFTVTDASGNAEVLSKEAYAQRYQIPKIARLDGSVADFLNSEEGRIWNEALEQIAFNNHAFAVIGVDNLNYLAEFSLQRSRIVEGRDFTAAELQNGSRVCLVQEALAAANDLQIGDSITLNLYGNENNTPYQYLGIGQTGFLNPTASFSFHTTTFTESVEYTIVGFYRCENWPDLEEDPYAFSANTVFVPKSSVPTAMEESNSIVFNTLVLQNGRIEAFHTLAKNAGYAGRFKYSDQDYGTVAANFHNYDALARQMLTTGVVLYSLMLLLFLLLYPGAQRKNVRRMLALGTGYFRRFWHVLVTSLGIVVSGSLLGGWLGNQLWDRLVAGLQASAESAVALQIQPEILTAIAGLQLIFAFVLVLFTALLVAIAKPISRRG